MSREQMIHDAAMEIMREVGVKIHNEKAVEILKQNGIKVEGNIAYFTEEQVMRWVKMAPESFTIYARNPKYNVYMGGDQVNPAATYGCAFIDDQDGTRRRGTMANNPNCDTNEPPFCVRGFTWRKGGSLEKVLHLQLCKL